MAIPREVVDIESFQTTKDIKLNEMVSKTRELTANSKAASSFWPPPNANQKAIDSVFFFSFFFFSIVWFYIN